VSHLSLQFLATGTSLWLLHKWRDSGSWLYSLWQDPYHSVSEVWTSRMFDCTPSENNNNLVTHWRCVQYRYHRNKDKGIRLNIAGCNKVLGLFSLLCGSRKYKITWLSHQKTIWGIKIKQITNTQRIPVKYTRAIPKVEDKISTGVTSKQYKINEKNRPASAWLAQDWSRWWWHDSARTANAESTR